MRVAARRYDNAQPVSIEVSGGRIRLIEPLSVGEKEALALPWVAPAFVDLQVNGYGGQEFSSAALTVEKVEAIAAQVAAMGVGRFCPTVTTQSRAVIEHAVATIAAACASSPVVRRCVLGIHVEGPYISPVDGPRGAHPAEHCRPPDAEELAAWQRASGGRVRLITLSPEYDGAAEFVRRAVSTGVTVAIGHTAADSGQIRAAVDAGARLSTHLGNGAHRELRRHPNYIWDQLAEDRLWASLIVDGCHLPPEVVKSFVRAKSSQRCVLVSDLAGLAGLPPGRYTSGLGETEILDDGRLVVAGQRQLLAGAASPIGEGVANVMRFAGLRLPEAVEMATRQPALVVGAPVRRLAAGEESDLVLFDLVEPRTEPATSAPGTAGPLRLVVRETIAAEPGRSVPA